MSLWQISHVGGGLLMMAALSIMPLLEPTAGNRCLMVDGDGGWREESASFLFERKPVYQNRTCTLSSL
jgi:hypothetical protein